MRSLRFLLSMCLIFGFQVCVFNAAAQDSPQWHLPEGAAARLGKGAVRALKFSANGARLAVASAIGIWHYDTSTGEEIALIPCNLYYGEAFSPDGMTFASLSFNGKIHLWDVESGILRQTLTGHWHSSEINSVAFSPDGEMLASGGRNGIRLWDIKSGVLRQTRTGHSDEVYVVAFSPDGEMLASGGRNKTVRLWDVESGVLQHTLGEHTNGITAVMFSPDGETLASGSFDGKIRLWDVESGVLQYTLEARTHGITAVMFSPDGETLASGSFNGKIRLWDVETGLHRQTLTAHGSGVDSIAFSPDGETLASGSWNNKVGLWDVESGVLRQTLNGHGMSVGSVAFSPNGMTLASGSFGGTAHLWDVGNGVLRQTLTLNEHELRGHVHSVVFSPDGRVLAGGNPYGTIGLWDVESGVLRQTLEGKRRSDKKRSLAFSPDGNMLAINADETVRLWDVHTGSLLKTLTGHADVVLGVAFSPGGEMLASGSRDETVRLWDVQTGQHLNTLIGHTSWVLGVAFSPGGEMLASGSRDETVRLWDARHGTHKETFAIPGTDYSHISAPIFSPDGRYLAIVDGFARVVLLEFTEGKEWELILQNSGGTFKTIAFSPDRRRLAAGNSNGTILLSDVTPFLTQMSPVETDSVADVPDIPTGTDVPMVSLSPASTSPGGIGEDLELNLTIAGGVDIAGYQATVAFNKTALRYVSTADAGYLPSGAFVVPPIVRGDQITLGATSLQGSSEGDGTLATFTFSVLTANPSMPILSDVKLTDSNADFLQVRIENSSVLEPVRLAGDVNGDGVVDVADMEAAAARLGQDGEDAADMNNNGVIDAGDLLLIAAAIEQANAAPSLHSETLVEVFTASEVRHWLRLARQQGLTEGLYGRGVLFLEQLLMLLTPEETLLLANYPNPFNPETWIPYQLSKSGSVNVSIYAADGKLVRTLTLGHQAAGIYESRSRAVYWDGRNDLGEPVASGVYFYTLTTDDFTATRKMLIRK